MKWGMSRSVHDAVLGDLTRTRGWWRGTVQLNEHGAVPLAIPGSRTAPDETAVHLARSIPRQYVGCREQLLSALRDHRSAYVDSNAAPLDALPDPTYAAVVKVDGMPTIELGYDLAWDDDHTIGGRLRDGLLVELNGSVLAP